MSSGERYRGVQSDKVESSTYRRRTQRSCRSKWMPLQHRPWLQLVRLFGLSFCCCLPDEMVPGRRSLVSGKWGWFGGMEGQLRVEGRVVAVCLFINWLRKLRVKTDAEMSLEMG